MPSSSVELWSPRWQQRWKMAVAHSGSACVHTRSLWSRLHNGKQGIIFEGSRLCLDRCFEGALARALDRSPAHSEHKIAHRIPLGLLLLSRQELTAEQLRIGLEEQRRSGHGKLGECLQKLGFIDERQLTGALARQWSCPVSKISSMVPRFADAPQIPFRLLESYSMVPARYVPSTNTLFVAFAEAVHYSVLYAIERMTGCRTEACMALPSFVRAGIQALTRERQQSEIAFDNVKDSSEFCRIVRSYCMRLTCSEIRLASCGPYSWIRLLCKGSPVDLLICFRKGESLI